MDNHLTRYAGGQWPRTARMTEQERVAYIERTVHVDLNISLGLYDCWITMSVPGGVEYEVTVQIKPELYVGPTTIYLGHMSLFVGADGVPRSKRNPKYPPAPYWLEIEEQVANIILTNS